MVMTSSSQPCAIDGPRRAEPRGEQHRGDARHQPGQAEQDELDAVDADAGELRRDRIVADGEDAAAEARAVQQERRRSTAATRNSTSSNDDHPPDIALAEEGEARRDSP